MKPLTKKPLTKIPLTMKSETHDHSTCSTRRSSRRDFLMTGSGAVTATFLISCGALSGGAEAQEVAGVRYERKAIGRISELANDEPVRFAYPFDDVYSQNTLVKLGTRAVGGVGSAQDIVAFNTLCTHMGGPLIKYNAEHKVLGACPLHLTTFALRRGGMVAAGNGTQNLPQIVLEVEGDELYAVGIIGLVFGKTNNLMRA